MIDHTLGWMALGTLLTGSGIAIAVVINEPKNANFIIAIIMIITATIVITLAVYDNMNYDKQMHEQMIQEKTMLDSMTCGKLGEWIINHSSNSTDSEGGYVDKNYPYAEAKYLVCTHSK